MTEPTKLQKMLRCSACAKSMLYGIIICVTIASLIIWWGVNGFGFNIDLTTLGTLISAFSVMFIGCIYGAKQCFGAYCDSKNDECYDDKFILGIAFFFSLVAFSLIVIIIANSEWFIELYERGMRFW